MTEERDLDEIYGLVEALSGRLDALREQAGGDEAILQRIREHDELVLAVPELVQAVDVLTDYVVGDKVPDPLHPGEFLINGRGQPMRNHATGLKAQVTSLIVLVRSLAP